MRYHEFIQRVQELAGTSPEDTLPALRATLATLGESLDRRELRHLAAELPQELSEALYALAPPTEAGAMWQRPMLDDFYDRVSARSDISHENAMAVLKATMRALTEAVSEGELRDVLEQLPPDYARLFSPVPQGT